MMIKIKSPSQNQGGEGKQKTSLPSEADLIELRQLENSEMIERGGVVATAIRYLGAKLTLINEGIEQKGNYLH